MTEALPVVAGTVLAGKYRVERVLGSGGMGVVVLAVHVDLGQQVAIKFLLAQALEHAEASQRFLREARAAVKIESEHVARVLDVGRLENGAPYMVMEYLDGSDLSTRPKGTSLSIEDAVDFVLQACEAMAVAHASGIIHRDLKPANLFVTQRPDGSPLLKVLDFGISKVSVLDAPISLTHTSAVMGSPLYMSPEQVQSARRVDARADIWSLGVILYELLTGAMPFGGESLGEVLTAVMTTTPAPIRAHRPEVPVGLERAVLRALEKPLEARYSNIGELATALIEFAPARSRVLLDRVSGVMHRAGFSSAPPRPAPGPSRRERTSTPPSAALPLPEMRRPPPFIGGTNASWVGGAAPPRRTRRLPFILGGVALIGIGVGLVALRGVAPGASAAASVQPPTVQAVAPSPPEGPIVAPVESPAPTKASPSPGDAPIVMPAAPTAAMQPTVEKARAARASNRTTATTPVAPSQAPAPVATPARPKKNPLNIQFK